MAAFSLPYVPGLVCAGFSQLISFCGKLLSLREAAPRLPPRPAGVGKRPGPARHQRQARPERLTETPGRSKSLSSLIALAGPWSPLKGSVVNTFTLRRRNQRGSDCFRERPHSFITPTAAVIAPPAPRRLPEGRAAAFPAPSPRKTLTGAEEPSELCHRDRSRGQPGGLAGA